MASSYHVAGKTGTAQVITIAQDEKYREEDIDERQRDHGLFVAFAPAEAPRIALGVVVENGGGGSPRGGARRAQGVGRLLRSGELCRSRALNGAGRPAAAASAGSRASSSTCRCSLILLAIVGVGMVVLYSAVSADTACSFAKACGSAVGLAAFFVVAQIPPHYLRIFTPWMYLLGIGLLLAVAVEGQIGKGAQRWLDLGVVTFQPSEILKLAVPMMCAWFMHERRLPPTFPQLMVMGLIVLTPALLIAEQPDLGTALLVMAGGALTILLAGISVRVMLRVRRARRRGAARAVGVHARLSEGARVHVLESRSRIRSAPATTSSNRRSRSARAACSARVG